jgi:hypothetical protein
MQRRRLSRLVGHIRPSDVIGESANLEDPNLELASADSLFVHRFTRVPIKIGFVDASQADERYGGSGDMVALEGELLKPPTDSRTVLVFMHPSGIMSLLPMPVALARAGVHVCCAVSRYPNNDSALIMEKCVIDLSKYVKCLKERHGYQKVVLVGWSGGGSLSTFYQAEAEQPTVLHTPAGDPLDLSAAGLHAADGLMLMAAHTCVLVRGVCCVYCLL